MRSGGFLRSFIRGFEGSKELRLSLARQVSAHGAIDQYDTVVLNYREGVVAGLNGSMAHFFYMDGPFKPAV